MAKQKKNKVRKKGLRAWLPLLTSMILIVSIMAVPSTILLSVGMLPTLAALMLDKSKNRTKTIAVGMLNLAACTPFLTQLWTGGNSVAMSIDMITDPVAIISMYAGAAFGYFMNWALSGISGAMLYKKAERRQSDIIKQQDKLKEKWGRKVTGNIPLTPEGFPILGREKQDS